MSTLAGPAALPPSAAAATAKKTASKSSKKSSASKSSKSKGSTGAAKSTGSTAKAAPAKAGYDPMAPSTSIPAAPASASASAAGAPPQRGPTRIDFDDRLIQGQTNKSGAVYLYDRKELKQRSMIKKRESFREEIVGAVYDSEL